MRTAWRLAAALGLASVAFAADGDLLLNGRFEEWNPLGPADWSTAEVGASRGPGPRSRIEKGSEGGVSLAGDAETKVWPLVSQVLSLEDKAPYRLAHVSRARGLRLDPGQLDNVYVGLRRGRTILADPVLSEDWTPGEVVFRASQEPTSALLFLSKTGRLEVREASLERLRPEDSYDVLVRNMARYYPTFPLRKVDWKAQADAYRKAALEAKDERQFIGVLRALLSPLRDLHVTIRDSDGATIPTFVELVKPNGDARRAIRGFLEDGVHVGNGTVGDVDEGVGYLRIDHLPPMDAVELQRALADRFDRSGWVLDLRFNQGGDETYARAIASLFADQERVYARRRVRSGPEPTDLGPPMEARIAPWSGRTFTKPVVCLIGPACVSSGEGFAQMMAAMPHVTMVGRATRGASGNPRPLELPNGVVVVYSRWVDYLPDGTVLEGKGVPPDVALPHEGDGDPTFEAGLRILREKIAR